MVTYAIPLNRKEIEVEDVVKIVTVRVESYSMVVKTVEKVEGGRKFKC